MLNRIRVVTMLMMVLVIFALLQLISGGLFFSSLKQNQESYTAANDLRLQQRELTSARDLMLQTRINLSRSSARMMMDPNNQQSSAKTDLLKNARGTLADSAKHYDAFKQITPQPAMEQASLNIYEKYKNYAAGLAELIQFWRAAIRMRISPSRLRECRMPSNSAQRVRHRQQPAISDGTHRNPRRLPLCQVADGDSGVGFSDCAGWRLVRHSAYPAESVRERHWAYS